MEDARSGQAELTCKAGPLCPRWGPAVQLREAEMPVQPLFCPDLSSRGAVQTEFAKRRLPPGWRGSPVPAGAR